MYCYTYLVRFAKHFFFFVFTKNQNIPENACTSQWIQYKQQYFMNHLILNLLDICWNNSNI